MSGPQLPSPAPSPFPGAQHGGAGGATDPSPSDQARLRADVENQLLTLVQDLYEMEICAGDVAPDMEGAVPDYLAKINRALANLSAMSGQLTDSVPRAVVDHVDRYKNPHQYTKTTLSRATGENQFALGRALGVESFRRQLGDAIGDAFPDMPLPERQHQPQSADAANGSASSAGNSNGAGASAAKAAANGRGANGTYGAGKMDIDGTEERPPSRDGGGQSETNEAKVDAE